MQRSPRSCGHFLILAVFWIVSPAFSQETPASSTDVPESDEPKKTPTEICAPEGDADKLIDRVHDDLYKWTCSSISWFDGLFGDRRYYQQYRGTNGSLTVGTLWSQRDNFDKLLRFKAHVYLPQASERFHAFIGRSNRDEFVTEAREDLYQLPNQFARGPDDDLFVGLGYTGPMQKRGSFDADAGVRLQFPVDPYVRGSYRFSRPLGESNLVHFSESIFWEKIEGFGTTVLVEWDHIAHDKDLIRWSNSATFSQESIGTRWFSTLTRYHSIDSLRAIAYEVAANGSTDLPVPLSDYGVAAIFRQRVWRDYLVLELRTGMDWPRVFLYETRRSNLNAGLAFELRYGQ